MGKRKRRDYDDILRNIKKIASKRNRRRYKTSSTESESDHREYEGEHSSGTHENLNEAVMMNESLELTDLPPEPCTSAAPGVPPAIPARCTSVAAASTEGTPLTQADPREPVDSENGLAKPSDDKNVPSLEPEILDLLGEDPTSQKNFRQKLHKDIASRWTHILTNGLTKDVELELVKRYLPPENCPNMKAPKLNLEIKAALLEINVKKDLYSQSKQNQLSLTNGLTKDVELELVKRYLLPENCPNMKAPKLNLEIKAALLEINVKKDLYSQSKQNQLSSSLTAIGQALNWALASKDVVPQDIIKTLSDASRLICDSHYRESRSRRFAALNTLNKDITKIQELTSIFSAPS